MATRTFIGNVLPKKDVWTGTVANTWATNDTATVTINGKSLVVTIGSLVTTAQVATTISEAIMSTAFTDTTASVTPSGGGRAFAELAELTAAASGSTVVITASTAGVPHTISASETTAGSGTFTMAHTVTAVGPSYFSGTGNYGEGSVPVSNDDLIIDRPVSMLYDLDQNSITLTSLTVGPRLGSTNYVGLPVRNTNGYEEYREDEFKISATTVNYRGLSGRFKLNTGSNQTTVNVYSSGTSVETGRNAFQWQGTHSSNVVNVYGGDVGIASNLGDAATVATLRMSGGTVVCGTGATLTTIDKAGGTLTTDSAATTVTQDSGTATLRSGAHTTVTVNGGTVYYPGTGTITNFTLEPGAVFNVDGSTQALTITNATIRGGTIIDTAKRITFTNAPTGWGKAVYE